MGGRREGRGGEREGRKKGREEEGKGGLAPRSWGDRRPCLPLIGILLKKFRTEVFSTFLPAKRSTFAEQMWPFNAAR